MDRTTARALLVAQCQQEIYPTLDDWEIDALIDAQEGFTIWAAAAAYHYGDMIQPTVRNGHLYKCIFAGTSAATEPFWPTYTRPDDRVGLTRPHWHGYIGPLPGSQVEDNGVIWLEGGPDVEGQYDARSATYQAWLMKAAKATADYDEAIDKDQFSRSQVITHCTDMALRYRPTGIF